MTTDLIKILNNATSKQAVDTIGKLTHIETSAVKAGIDVITPMILARISANDNILSNKTLIQLLTNFAGNKRDEIDTDNLHVEDTAEKGKHLINSIFENKKETVIAAVVVVSGMPADKAQTLLSVSTPLILGYLVRWSKSKNWTFANLRSNLLENKSGIIAAFPAGVNADMFFADTLQEKPLTHPKTTQAFVKEPRSSNKNWLKWFLWFLLLGVLLWLIFVRGCNNLQKNQITPIATDSVETTDSFSSSKPAYTTEKDSIL
ncbi:MAG: DUF937 domain-containing protein [Paludibacteraceae bacterium]